MSIELNIVIQTAMKQPTGVVFHRVDGIDVVAIRVRERMSKMYEEAILKKAEEMKFADFKVPEFIEILYPPTETYIDRGDARKAVEDAVRILNGNKPMDNKPELKAWVTVDGDMVLPLKDINKGGCFKIIEDKNQLVNSLKRLGTRHNRDPRYWRW